LKKALGNTSTAFGDKLKNGLKQVEINKKLAVEVMSARTAYGRTLTIIANSPGCMKSFESLGVEVGSTQEVDSLKKEVDKLLNYVLLLEDSMSGFDGFTTQEAIRLYYFPSVPEAMKALNLDAKLYSDDFFKIQSDEDLKRTALLDAEQELQLIIHESNMMLDNIRNLKTSLEAKKTELAKVTTLSDTLSSQLKQYDQYLNSEAAKEAANTAKTTLINKKKSEAEQTQSSLSDKKKKLSEDTESQQSEITSLQAKLDAAEAARADKINKKNALSLNLSKLASAESEAFAYGRDHQAFWLTTPLRTSDDPVNRPGTR
jgi:hypothetical protein